MKKKIIIITTIFAILITTFVFISERVIPKDDLLSTIKKYDPYCNEIIVEKHLYDYTVVLYEVGTVTKGMILLDDKLRTKFSSDQKISALKSFEDYSSLLIIFGIKDDDFYKYTYSYNDLKIEKIIEDEYILDLYMLDKEYIVGDGNVYSIDNEVIYEF